MGNQGSNIPNYYQYQDASNPFANNGHQNSNGTRNNSRINQNVYNNPTIDFRNRNISNMNENNYTVNNAEVPVRHEVVNLAEISIDNNNNRFNNNVSLNNVNSVNNNNNGMLLTQDYLDEYTHLVSQIQNLEKLKNDRLEQQLVITSDLIEFKSNIQTQTSQLDELNRREVEEYELLLRQENEEKFINICKNIENEFEKAVIFNSTILYNERQNMSIEEVFSKEIEEIDKIWTNRENQLRKEFESELNNALAIANEEHNIQYQKVLSKLTSEYEEQKSSNKRKSNIFDIFSINSKKTKSDFKTNNNNIISTEESASVDSDDEE